MIMMESTETALDLHSDTDSRLNPVRTPGPGPQPDSASAELTQAKAEQVSVWTLRGLCGRGLDRAQRTRIHLALY